MSNKNKITTHVTNNPDGSTTFQIPEQFLKQLGWKDGDQIAVTKDDKGRIIFTKADFNQPK